MKSLMGEQTSDISIDRGEEVTPNITVEGVGRFLIMTYDTLGK